MPADELRRGRGRLYHGLHQNAYPTPAWATPSPTRENPAAPSRCPAIKQVQPMVFSGVYPADGAKYGDLRDALEKLKLNDASLSYDAGNLHGARLRLPLRLPWACCTWRSSRSGWSASTTSTSSRPRRASSTASRRHDGDDASSLTTPPTIPDPAEIRAAWRSRSSRRSIMTPPDYVGSIMELCQERRGVFRDMKYLDEGRVELHYSSCRSTRSSTTSSTR